MTAGAGVFNDRARAAILEVGLGRCIGCGRPDVSCQHRHARGMGGTSNLSIGHPANGVPLCGGELAGVRGCHGWAEAHPTDAALLGWRLNPGQSAIGAPFYTRVMGPWRAWDDDLATVYVDVDDLDQLEDRQAAVRRLEAARPAPQAGRR